MEKERRRTTLISLGLSILTLAALVAAGLVYRHYARLESTDDAQVDGYIYPVTSRVSGYVMRVTVDDNQYVQAGTVLVQLDAKDYEVAVANARATMANQQASSAASRINVPLTAAPRQRGRSVRSAKKL